MSLTTGTHPAIPEAGCYGDGALGHQHTRAICAGVLRHYENENFTSRGQPAPNMGDLSIGDIDRALRGDMSDDAWEEYAACDWLNEHAPFTGAWWGWQDGDFGLWLDESEEP